MSNKIPMTKALLWIFLSTLVVSGSATLGWLYYLHVIHERASDEDYTIKAIVQSGPEGQQLPTEYLAEVLGVSANYPQNLYAYDLVEGKKALLRSPLIKSAILKRARPDALYVEYTVCQPVARLGDYYNIAIDEEGSLFPYKPFFDDRPLPELFLGLTAFGTAEGGSWNEPITGERYQLACVILKTLRSQKHFEGMAIERVDVSKAFAGSCGQREIVVQVEDVQEKFIRGEPVKCYMPKTLRLTAEGWRDELKNYKVLRSYLCAKELDEKVEVNRSQVTLPITVVDMRLPQLAFLNEYRR